MPAVYSLWDTMPDDALLDSASQEELNSREDVARMARRMLDDPRARQSLDDFVSQWLRFDRALTAARDHHSFPLFNHELVVAMTEEARRFVQPARSQLEPLPLHRQRARPVSRRCLISSV
jgi:hypothetical protein